MKIQKLLEKSHTHLWQYRGGQAKCKYCNKYVQPDGTITHTPYSKKK